MQLEYPEELVELLGSFSGLLSSSRPQRGFEPPLDSLHSIGLGGKHLKQVLLGAVLRVGRLVHSSCLVGALSGKADPGALHNAGRSGTEHQVVRTRGLGYECVVQLLSAGLSWLLDDMAAAELFSAALQLVWSLVCTGSLEPSSLPSSWMTW